MKDNYRRTIDYMRISVTDRCNLRCLYCMPSDGLMPMEHKEILRYEEIARIVNVAVHVGLKKIRITGGEPLVRKNIPHLIKLIKGIEGIEDLSLTTNGVMLEQFADSLAAAGLDRVNVSLDSLRPGRYREITRGGDISRVFGGIEAAVRAGLEPVKINMVPIRGINDDEISDFALMTMKYPYQVRFIEFMPFGMPGIWNPERLVPAAEIKSIVEKIGILTPARQRKSGPARYFKLTGAVGVIGFISPLSNHFCGECNRLRLTADGKIKPCLFSETEIDLRTALRDGVPDSEIERLVRLSIEIKPQGHNMSTGNDGIRRLSDVQKGLRRPMSKIGG